MTTEKATFKEIFDRIINRTSFFGACQFSGDTEPDAINLSNWIKSEMDVEFTKLLTYNPAKFMSPTLTTKTIADGLYSFDLSGSKINEVRRIYQIQDSIETDLDKLSNKGLRNLHELINSKSDKLDYYTLKGEKVEVFPKAEGTLTVYIEGVSNRSISVLDDGITDSTQCLIPRPFDQLIVLKVCQTLYTGPLQDTNLANIYKNEYDEMIIDFKEFTKRGIDKTKILSGTFGDIKRGTRSSKRPLINTLR